MCGIGGIVSKNSFRISELQKMSDVLKHRGPDDEGYFVSGDQVFYLRGNDSVPDLQHLPHILDKKEFCRIGLLHRRLSIIDLSAAGHQPMTAGDLVISYNGEIYNYKEVREELLLLGEKFQSDSDTEVILKAYTRWGKECVKKFVGMWAFAIFDLKKNELFLCRDRFGIKPLYFFLEKERFVFASEIKAILQIENVKSEASLKRSLEFICFGSVSDPEKNLFESIEQLGPGQYLTLDVRSLEVKTGTYYDLNSRIKTIDTTDAGKQFSSLLDDSLRLHLRSDVEIGSALSGGLDSSSIVALAADLMQGKKFKTFTAAYQQSDIDESRYAKLVSASIKNIEAEFAYPDAQTFWKDFDKLIWQQDLPIGSTSMFAQWEVMKLAAQKKVKVLLDGQGADEILGGYYNFAGIFLISQLKQFHLGKYFHERSKLKENFTAQINKAIGRAGFYFLPEFLQRKLREKNRLSFHFLSKNYLSEAAELRVPDRGGKNFREQSLLSVKYGLQDLLRYEDRNSMAFSIESRVPFLDHRLVEFCLALPDEEKIRDGWTKFALRKKAEGILPGEVVWRKDKVGFVTPQKNWKSELQIKLLEYVSSAILPDFIDRSYLVSLCKKDFADSTHLSEFWRVISFIKWCEIFRSSFR